MRGSVPLAVLLAVASCADAQQPGEIPAPLARLRLNVEHPTMTPVDFDHERHASTERLGAGGTCASCHHTLAEHPDEVPQRCGACHVPSYLLDPEETEETGETGETGQRVDETVPHDHPPPDL